MYDVILPKHNSRWLLARRVTVMFRWGIFASCLLYDSSILCSYFVILNLVLFSCLAGTG